MIISHNTSIVLTLLPWKVMYNNTNSFQLLCSLDGIARNQSYVSHGVNVSTSVIIIILSPVAVAGNALILATIWKTPSLRTPSYILLCGLSFTDFCTGIITQPFYFATEMICLQEPQDKQDRLSFLLFAKVVSEGCGTYVNSMTLLLITLMSIERWLYMTRRLLVTVHRAYLIVAVILIGPLPIAVLRSLQILHGTHGLVLNTISFILLLICFLTTSIAYFKVFRIITRHQQQVQAHAHSQSFGQPAINLAKYKNSVFSILFIVALFYISYMPFLAFVGLYLSRRNHSEVALVFKSSMIFIFLSSSLNPLLYLWRMRDIRNGVKQLLKKLFCQCN